MKRFFALFFFVIMLLSPVSVVLAGNDEDSGITESEEDAVERDDVGRISSGTITVNGRDSYIWGLSLYEASYNVVLSDGDGYLYITVGDDWGDYSKASWVCHLHLVGNYSLKVSTVTHYKDDSEHTSWDDTTSSSVPLSDTSYPLTFYNMNNEDFSKYFSFSSSIPIFKVTDEESINKYVNEGDYSGATNKDDVDKSLSHQDGSVELPRDLKVTKGYATGLVSAYSLDKDCVFTWNQTVDTSGYVYDVDAQMVIGTVTHSGSAVLTGDKYGSGWVNIVDSYHYDGAQQMTRSITASQLNDILLVKCFDNYIAATNKKLTYKGYLVSQLKIRVRNRSGTSVSDYVVITIDMDSASTTAKVEDEEGNDVKNDEYTGQDVSDPDKPSVTDSDLSLTGILDYIRSGFGLLGSGGLLSLMSSAFSYIPSSVWTLIKTAIAVSITIMVLSLVKRFVFG